MGAGLVDLNYQAGEEKMSALHRLAYPWADYIGPWGIRDPNCFPFDIFISLGADKTLRTTRGHTAYDLLKQGLARHKLAEDHHAEVRRALEL